MFLNIQAMTTNRGDRIQYNTFGHVCDHTSSPNEYKKEYSKSILRGIIIAICVLAINMPLFANEHNKPDQSFRLLVYMPSILADSALEESIIRGARRAVAGKRWAQYDLTYGGNDETLWQNELITIITNDRYDLIVSIGQAIADIFASLSRDYPHQRFLALDATLTDDSYGQSASFDRNKQLFVSGYLAGLILNSGLPHIESDRQSALLFDARLHPEELIRYTRLGFESVNPTHQLLTYAIENSEQKAMTDLLRKIYESDVDVVIVLAIPYQQTPDWNDYLSDIYRIDIDQRQSNQGLPIANYRTIFERAMEQNIEQIMRELRPSQIINKQASVIDISTDYSIAKNIRENMLLAMEMDHLIQRLRTGSLILPPLSIYR